jgi:hypothetical protein
MATSIWSESNGRSPGFTSTLHRSGTLQTPATRKRDARAPVPEVRTIRSLAVMSIFDKYFKIEFKDVKVLWTLLFAWRPT